MKKKLSLICMILSSCLLYSNDFEDIINLYSSQEHIDPLLVKAIIRHESAGNTLATSPVGARGLMQVMPETAKFVGVDPMLLYTPNQNIKAGVLYLSYLKKEFNGDTVKMIAGYNAGHQAIKKYNGVPPYKETIEYTKRVLASYANLSKGKITFLLQPSPKKEDNFVMVVNNHSSNATEQKQNYKHNEKNRGIESFKVKVLGKNEEHAILLSNHHYKVKVTDKNTANLHQNKESNSNFVQVLSQENRSYLIY